MRVSVSVECGEAYCRVRVEIVHVHASAVYDLMNDVRGARSVQASVQLAWCNNRTNMNSFCSHTVCMIPLAISTANVPMQTSQGKARVHDDGPSKGGLDAKQIRL